jgi:hypothetical protein
MSAEGCLTSPRAVVSAGRRLSIAEKAFRGPTGAPTSARGHQCRTEEHNPLGHMVMPNITRVSSAAVSSAEDDAEGVALTTAGYAKHRPLSGRRLTKQEPSPAVAIAGNDTTSMFPSVAVRAHPPAHNYIGSDSITRKRQPSAGQHPPFGRSSYARGGLLTPRERHDKQVHEQLEVYQRRLGIPTMERQASLHFTTFESVFEGDIKDELVVFENRLEALQKQRAIEEAERLAKEQEIRTNAALKQQQQRRSTLVKSPIPVKGGFVVNNGGGTNQVLRRPSTYTPLGEQPHARMPSIDTPEPALPPPTANREHHLTKLMFRRLLLNENALVEWIMYDLGEAEIVRRLNVVNDRYGVRRINQEDFYFLMQEVMAEEHPIATSARIRGALTSAAARSRESRSLSMMLEGSVWEPIGNSATHQHEGQHAGGADDDGSNVNPPQQEPYVTPAREDLLDQQQQAQLQRTSRQASSWRRPYTLQRSDADLLFTACDWRLVGVVEDSEVVDSIRLLFRPPQQVIASHCKRVLEGRCSVSQMISMHEAATMLRAIADIARHRYGNQIDKDVDMVLVMLEEVMTSGYVPLVCFRNFTVHGTVLSRALVEMSVNAELPTATLHVPSPDPDRDTAAVALQLQQQQLHLPTTHGAGVPASQPPSPHSRSTRDRLFSKDTTVMDAPLSASKLSAHSAASERNHENRDLAHPRFRADQALVQSKASAAIPEHDCPQWYTSGGIVWMKNALHGPLAMT